MVRDLLEQNAAKCKNFAVLLNVNQLLKKDIENEKDFTSTDSPAFF